MFMTSPTPLIFRDFVCLSLSFDSTVSECWLFDHNKETSGKELEYDVMLDHYERLFYRGRAVVDEVHGFVAS